jgi:hypothetical protein
VDKQVVEPRRRQVVGQRLERQAVIARREPELGGRYLLGCLDAWQLGSGCRLLR